MRLSESGVAGLEVVGVFLLPHLDTLADGALANALVLGGDEGFGQADEGGDIAHGDPFWGDLAVFGEVVVIPERDGDPDAAMSAGLHGGGFARTGVQEAALHADGLLCGGAHNGGDGVAIKDGKAISDADDGTTAHDGAVHGAGGFDGDEDGFFGEGPLLTDMPGTEEADFFGAGKDGMEFSFDVEGGDVPESGDDHRATDEVIAGGSLDFAVGDFDGEVPGGDLVFDFAQAALHAFLHFGERHAAEEVPGVFGWLAFMVWGADEAGVIHVRAEDPGEFAFAFAVLVGDQEVAKFVDLGFEMRAALKQSFNFFADVVFVEGRGRLLQNTLENGCQSWHWHVLP